MRKYILFLMSFALLTQPSFANFRVEVLGINPAGGTIGQVLTKDSGVDYDYSWQTPSGGGGTPGGSSGQVQYNNSGAFGGASFITITGGSDLDVGGILTSNESIRLKSGNTAADPGLLIFTDPTSAVFQAIMGDDVTTAPLVFHGSQLNLNSDDTTMLLRTAGATGISISTSQVVQFNAYGAGTLTTNGSGVISAASDETLKDIQGPYERGVEDLKAIKPIMFKWKKDDPSGFSYAGFSAQNVEKGLPEAVSEGPDGKLVMQDRALMAALVNAVNQLSARIEKLEGDKYVAAKIAPAPKRQKSPKIERKAEPVKMPKRKKAIK